MSRPLTPGERVLVLVSRLELAPENRAALAALVDAGLDWQGLLQDGETFGVLPLLHHHLSVPELSARVPSEVRVRLGQAYHRQSLRNIRMLGLLDDILTALAAASIPVIPLKGAFLAPWLYGDVGLRPMGDLDLLVRPGDRHGVETILRSMGFQDLPENQTSIFNCKADRDLNERLSHPSPMILDRICRVESHIAILQDASPWTPSAMDKIWAASLLEEGTPRPIRTLSPEYLFLFLAAHLDKHISNGPGRFIWFCDLHELISRSGPSLNWGRLAELAASLGKEGSLKRVLGWLKEDWGSVLPPGVPAGGGMPLTRILDQGRRFRLDPTGQPSPFSLWRRLALVRQIPAPKDKLLFLAAFLVLPRAKMKAVHNPRTPFAWVFWYLAHPAWKTAQILRRLARYAQHRLHS